MLTDNIGVHGLLLHLEKLAEPVPQACPVQHCPAAEDEMSRPGGGLDSDPGQHVNWVGYHDHDCRRAHPVKLTDDASDRIRVSADGSRRV